MHFVRVQLGIIFPGARSPMFPNTGLYSKWQPLLFTASAVFVQVLSWQ